ncbi:MAG: hypothetical protein HC866_03640 [Leptolyngbyaceae cyanobacterium RU_5_1]|nr:hypothetical protein [Leptolyngbyaceae cyanobacterium RU_5_1]
MKPLSLKTIIPATAIAVGATAIASQPSHAYGHDYSNFRDCSYRHTRIQIPSLERAYRRSAPSYHYVYYYIARPKYLI